ncbi:MAG: hypothetical protein KC621_17745 [Myxococcales bacterium]|nr:hypothetical protein [Myxococcales bacterium]
MIGYSQVGMPDGGWFVTGEVFEAIVDDDHWQLLWNSGGGVDRWQDPSYEGWSQPIQSPCSEGSDAPDRVLLSVSGPYGEDEQAWLDAILATIDEIESRMPSVEEIVLQPVVGGPGEQACPSSGGGAVRASWQHSHIDAAIAMAVGGEVTAGASPEVADCTDYADGLGHLVPEAAEAIAAELGAYYAE